MQKRVATLEPHEHDTLPHPSDAPPAQADRGRARELGRFQYANGARPLGGYTIKRGVGQGGFGEIYYATSDAGKDVALKLVRRNLDVELRGIRQCLNLKHPHLIDLYDIRQDDADNTWVVMEFIADQNLEDVLAEHPDGLTPVECMTWIHGIGAGVAYLHDRGIVHRDLKPGNIFCDEGVVKVGDYGLSKFISCSRRSGHTESIGTVHYMAPEVANGRYGKEIDVYALGVILYELLTGRVPFEGESIGEVLMKHLTAKPDVSMIAEPYRAVVARAMEKDPAMRYRSVGEMLSALPPPERDKCIFAQSSKNSPNAPETSRDFSADAVPREPAAGPRQVPEDPVLRALRRVSTKLRHAIREQPIWVKVLLAIAILMSFSSLPALAWIAAGLAIAYAIFRLIWTAWHYDDRVAPATEHSQNHSRELTAPGAPPPASPQPASSKTSALKPFLPRHGLLRRRERIVPRWQPKPLRERLTELLGSMLGSVLAAGVMCVVITLIDSLGGHVSNVSRPEQFAWLMSVTVAGSWGILILAKFWEGARGDSMIRRFMMMVVGMAVGAAAFGLSELLMVSLPFSTAYPQSLQYNLPQNFHSQDGHPLLMAYMACFGVLFLVVRWWLQTDPLRKTRLSLMKLLLSVLVAGVVAWMWQFPQPWLPLLAGSISVAVQLASPTVRERPEMK